MSIHKSYFSKNNTIQFSSFTNTGLAPYTELYFPLTKDKCILMTRRKERDSDYINISINFSDNKIIMNKNNKIIFNVDNYIKNNYNIKNIYCKNNLKNNDIYLKYIDKIDKNNENDKLFIYNPNENIENFYTYNYTNNYIKKIFIEDLI